MATKKTPALAPKKPGRKPIPDDQRAVMVSLRLTPAARDKFAQLGGVDWLRRVIEKARIPVTIEAQP